MRVRKKPVEVEAEQFFIENFTQKKYLPEGVIYHYNTAQSPQHCFSIKTLEGNLKVSDGDWIITGVKGERYPCKPDIFKATYEPVIDSPQSKLEEAREILENLWINCNNIPTDGTIYDPIGVLIDHALTALTPLFESKEIT